MNGLLGYITFYFKVCSNEQVAYAKINNDFRKLYTKNLINSIKEGIEGIYKEAGMDVLSVTFCSEQEYKSNKSDNTIIEHKWNDEIGIPKLKFTPTSRL